VEKYLLGFIVFLLLILGYVLDMKLGQILKELRGINEGVGVTSSKVFFGKRRSDPTTPYIFTSLI